MALSIKEYSRGYCTLSFLFKFDPHIPFNSCTLRRRLLTELFCGNYKSRSESVLGGPFPTGFDRTE